MSPITLCVCVCVWRRRRGGATEREREREIKSSCLQAGVSVSPDSLISWSTGCATNRHFLGVRYDWPHGSSKNLLEKWRFQEADCDWATGSRISFHFCPLSLTQKRPAFHCCLATVVSQTAMYNYIVLRQWKYWCVIESRVWNTSVQHHTLHSRYAPVLVKRCMSASLEHPSCLMFDPSQSSLTTSTTRWRSCSDDYTAAF